MKPPKPATPDSWAKLDRYLRTCYGVVDVQVTTDVLDGGATVAVTLANRGVITVLLNAEMVQAAGEDFSIVWSAVDKACRSKLEEVRSKKIKIRHPDDLLWSPPKPKREQTTLSDEDLTALVEDKPLDLWEQVEAEGLVEVIKKLKAPAMPPSEAPDLTEWVLGYREWYVTNQHQLTALSFSSVGGWKGPFEVKAKCPTGKEHSEGLSEWCDCGFYAYDKHERLATTQLPILRSAAGKVAGVIRARGVMFTDISTGFRAEFAQPLALGYRDDNRAHVEAVGEALGLPVVPILYLPTFGAQYGSELPASMKPIERWETRWYLECAQCDKAYEALVVDDRSDVVPTTSGPRARLAAAVQVLREQDCECGVSLMFAPVTCTTSRL